MRLDVARARGMPSYACAVNNLVVQWKHMPLARQPGFRLSWIVHTAPYGHAGNRVSRDVEEPRPIILNRGDRVCRRGTCCGSIDAGVVRRAPPAGACSGRGAPECGEPHRANVRVSSSKTIIAQRPEESQRAKVIRRCASQHQHTHYTTRGRVLGTSVPRGVAVLR